jgi:hypothetical protein
VQRHSTGLVSVRLALPLPWVAYTDFTWIAHRHGIANREKEFKMASEVISSITSTVQK